MKNFITYLIITMAVIFLFTSCGSSLTVTKRHYNKGYHVSYNKLKQSDRSNSNELTNDQLALSEEEIVIANSVHLEDNTTKKSISEGILFEDKYDAPEENISIEKTQPEKSIISASDIGKNIVAPITKIKNSFSDLKELKSSQPREEGLSLLWIIIVIILILWALGLIGGFGGDLIHLLLVIALILLILWLLGII